MKQKFVVLCVILFFVVGLLPSFVGAVDQPILIDKFDLSSVSNYGFFSNDPSGNSSVSAYSQSFRIGSVDMNLSSVTFYLYKAGSPTGDLVARVYSSVGSSGSDSTPGVLLDTSVDMVDISALAGSSTAYQFNFSGSVMLSANTYYQVVVARLGGVSSASNVAYIATKGTGGHAGNKGQFASSVWVASATVDVYFYVRGFSSLSHGSVVDYFDGSNYLISNLHYLKAVHPSASSSVSAVAQCFAPNATVGVGSAVVWMRKDGSPVANVSAKIVGVSGSYGSTSIPNETSVVCYSNNSFNTAFMTNSIVPYYFNFESVVNFSVSVKYALVVYVENASYITTSDYVTFFSCGAGSVHSGNYVTYYSSGWVYPSGGSTGYDLPFYVYELGDPLPTPVPTSTPVPTVTPYVPSSEDEALWIALFDYIVYLLVLLVPALLLWWRAGKWGFVTGLIVGSVISYMFFGLASNMWGIILVGSVIFVAVVAATRGGN